MFHQQHGGAALAINAHDDFENFLRQFRRKSEAGFVEQHHFRLAHDGAADGEHLLLTAGEQPGVLLGALFQNRKITIHFFHVALHAVAILARVGPHDEIVMHGQQRKNFAAFGHVADTAPHDVGRVFALDRLAFEGDRALLRIDDARNGF